MKKEVLLIMMKVKEIENMENESGKCDCVRVNLCIRIPRGKSNN